jgi:hypothetical protein
MSAPAGGAPLGGRLELSSSCQMSGDRLPASVAVPNSSRSPSGPPVSGDGNKTLDGPVVERKWSEVTLPTRLIVVSGPICAGKTSLCNALAPWAHRVGTRGIIASTLGKSELLSRGDLQSLGDDLDRRMGADWIVGPVREALEVHPLVCVDAARTEAQVLALSALARALHVHLTAPDPVLEARQAERFLKSPHLELPSLRDLRVSRTESDSRWLGHRAHLVLDTGENSPRECARRTLNAAGAVTAASGDA